MLLDMLDVIGAGATAHSDIDWHSVWMGSPERQEMKSQLDEILQREKEVPAVQQKRRTEFSATFSVQMFELTRRAFIHYLRSPTYLISKLAVNTFAGKAQLDAYFSFTDVCHYRDFHWIFIFQSKE